MKIIFKLTVLLSAVTMYCQDAVHNYGTIQIHDTGLVGFHMNVINDGTFNQNLGLVGFYNTNSLTVSGTSNPVFYDVEIAVDNNLYIENTIGVLNNANLITGTLFTPRTSYITNLSFISDSFYNGESDNNMVDGYVSILGKTSFTFPIGENSKLRPLTILSEDINDYARSAYFEEDPNSPSIFGTSFNTTIVENEFISVSTQEFWQLEGEKPSKVTLTWDEESIVLLLAETLADIKVVGWNIENEQWENLGNTETTGDMVNGSIISDTFIPNNYEIITLGGNNDLNETFSNLELDNYFVTPDGDGINDQFIIDGLEDYPNNTLNIYNRYGVLVFSQQNYLNEFIGVSNRQNVHYKYSGLPSGVYYYILSVNDLELKHQGYLYLSTYESD